MLQPQPPGFKDHSHKFSFSVKKSAQDTWNWLNKAETFTDTQIPPYKVEFYSPDPETIPNGFHEGVLNIHHGPFINFAGVLTKIDDLKYRDLQYYYGSYAFNLRWIRPYRLQFWLNEKSENEVELTAEISSWVKPWISGTWSFFQSLFWKRFPRWARRSI